MPTSPIWKNALLACALTPTLIFGGCLGRGNAPIARKLPDAPASMAPVAVPTPKPGGDVRASRYDYAVALDKANTRLRASALWYQSVVLDFGRDK